MTVPPKHLNIGVLLMDTVQLLDAAPIDLFGMLSVDYLKFYKLPDHIISLAPTVTIRYISQSYDDCSDEVQVHPCTASTALRITRSLKYSDVAPGKLDILLIPGPGPYVEITPEVGVFVRGHAAKTSTYVLSICVGVYVAAQAGILDGKTVTGTARYLPDLEKKFDKAHWVKKRWMEDGNIWTSGRFIALKLIMGMLLH
jgi:transcriptional regulator GlxA family with amidase domain